MIAEDTLRLPESESSSRREGTIEERLSPRRRTLAAVRVLEGAEPDEDLQATDLSADGAFLRRPVWSGPTAALGARLRLRLEIPTDPKPIVVAARVVRAALEGIGVRFEEVSARDRSRLRAYAGFYEMDEAMVDVQRTLGDLIPGNLLPLGETSGIEEILRGAVEKGVQMTAILPGRGFRPLSCLAVALEERENGQALILEGLNVPAVARALHLAFAEPPLHYALEGIVLARGERPAVLVPERIYLTERRNERRTAVRDAWCELPAPWEVRGHLRLPVLDLGDGGASVRLRSGAALVPGTHLPAFTLDVDGELRRIGGATVRYVTALDDEGFRGAGLRAGLRFDEGDLERDSFRELRQRTTRETLGTRIARAASLLGGRMAALVGRSTRRGAAGTEGVEVSRSANPEGRERGRPAAGRTCGRSSWSRS